MYEWDLTPLYSGFQSEEFESDCKKLFTMSDAMIGMFKKQENSGPANFIADYLRKNEELQILSSKVFGFINLSLSANTLDKEAKKAMVTMQALSGKFALLDNKLKTYLKSIDNLDEVIDSGSFLHQYRFILHEAKAEMFHTMDEDREVLVAELTQNGSNLWSQMQRTLTSTAEIEFRGEKKSLNEIRNLAYSSDPAIRKEAYSKELEIYKAIEEPIAFAISGIKGEVNTLCKKRQFASPLEETLFKSRMKKETLDALLQAMKEYLPRFQRYLKHKAKLLGHQGGLPWYDLFAPMGKSEKQYTVEEAQAFILLQFGSFSAELKNLAKQAFDNHWIDYLPRKGKVGGAFCSNNRALKQSRILSNFGGEIGDVITLSHELGHAFHGEQIFQEAVLNSHYTMPVAETASTLCETIVKRAAYQQAKSSSEKIHILEQELQDATQVIVDIYSRYLFEQQAFDAREQSIPSAEDLNKLMTDAQKQAYGEGLDPEYLNPGMWICKSHYYRGSLSFYNFPYAFGLLFARGIYQKYLEIGPNFISKIDTLLRSTGKMTVEDAALTVGIDLSDSEFWKKGLETFSEDIEEFIRLTEDSL